MGRPLSASVGYGKMRTGASAAERRRKGGGKERCQYWEKADIVQALHYTVLEIKGGG